MTILFKKDWLEKYPSAVIHVETKNKSFLELAYKLQRMGVENHYFFLALHNPELRHIDPYDPNLTVRQMTAVMVECIQNFWYYVREVARAPATVGIEPEMVGCNRYNLSYWWSLLNHITYIGTIPRQCGKSFAADLIATWLMNFACTNTQMNLLTKDDTLRAANIKRLKEIYEELPSYLNLKTREDAANTETLTVKKKNNTYLTHVPQASPKRAYNLGRGLTSPIWFGDEFPYVVNVDISMPAALAAMGAVVESAKAKGEPYFVSLTTTAGKKDEPSGRYMYNYLSDGAQWSERFYDTVDIEDLERIVRVNSRKKVFRIYGCFSHLQLGKSDAWLKEQLERTNQTPDDANRDYFNIWTSGTESSPLPIATLELLSKSIVPTVHTQIFPTGGYILRWYIAENQRENYLKTNRCVIGIDTSDATGNDDISFVMTDVETGAVVAVGTFNETNLIMFAQYLVYILVNFPLSTMIIERRSSAATIIDYLLMFLPQHGIDPFERLFNWIMNDPLEHKVLYDEACLPMRRRSEDLYVRAKKYFGFATSGSGQTSRTELYSTTLQNAMKRCASKVLDRALTEQITGLIIKNGRVDHEDGGHDDLVIGYLLTHWLLSVGKNLSQYGIDPTRVLLIHKVQKEVKPENAFAMREQQELRQRIQTLYTQMSTETDEFVLKKLEQDMRNCDSRLILEDNENFSIDTVLQELHQKKKMSRYQRSSSSWSTIR